MPGSEGDYGAGQMGALWDKFKRLKAERDIGAGSKWPFNYSPARASGAEGGELSPCSRAVPCRAMPQRGLAGERWDAASRPRLVFLFPQRRGAASNGHVLPRCSRAPSPAPVSSPVPPTTNSLLSAKPSAGKGVGASAAACFGCKVTIVLLFCLAGRGAGGNSAAQKAARNSLCHN